jgi:chromosomal replication initiation ATPase DnaA
MPKGSNDVRDVLTAVINACEINDTKDVIDALNGLSNNEKDATSKITSDLIIEQVCLEYQISKKTLIHSTARGHINQAKKQVCCLMNQLLNSSTRRTGKVLLCDANTVSRALKYQRELSIKIPEEVLFKETNEKLFNKLNQLK